MSKLDYCFEPYKSPNVHAIKKRICDEHVRQHSTSKFCFYHLPTRGRAGIKLGDADTSPTYLYFLIVSCYYIICFGCLMGFNMLFYIIFGTNLLTRGPVPVPVFLPISEFRRKGISNGIQTERNLREDLFWYKCNPGDLEWKSRKQRGS